MLHLFSKNTLFIRFTIFLYIIILVLDMYKKHQTNQSLQQTEQSAQILNNQPQILNSIHQRQNQLQQSIKQWAIQSLKGKYQLKIKAMQDQLKNKNKEIDILLQQKKASLQQKLEWQNKINQYNVNMSNLQNERKAFELQKKQFQAKQSLIKANDLQKAQFTSKYNEQQYIRRIENSLNKIKSLETQLVQKQAKLDQSEDCIKSCLTYQQNLQQKLRTKVQQIKSIKQKNKEQLTALQIYKLSLQKQYNKFKQQLRKIEQQKWSDKIYNLQLSKSREINKSNKKLAQVEQQLKTQKEIRSALQNQVYNIENAINNLKKDLNRYQTQIEEHIQTITNLQQSLKEKQQFSQLKQQHKKQIKILITSFNQQVEKKINKNNNDQMLNRQKIINALRKDFQNNIQNQKRKVDKLKQQIDQLRQKQLKMINEYKIKMEIKDETNMSQVKVIEQKQKLIRDIFKLIVGTSKMPQFKSILSKIEQKFNFLDQQKTTISLNLDFFQKQSQSASIQLQKIVKYIQNLNAGLKSQSSQLKTPAINKTTFKNPQFFTVLTHFTDNLSNRLYRNQQQILTEEFAKYQLEREIKQLKISNEKHQINNKNLAQKLTYKQGQLNEAAAYKFLSNQQEKKIRDLLEEIKNRQEYIRSLQQTSANNQAKIITLQQSIQNVQKTRRESLHKYVKIESNAKESKTKIDQQANQITLLSKNVILLQKQLSNKKLQNDLLIKKNNKLIEEISLKERQSKDENQNQLVALREALKQALGVQLSSNQRMGDIIQIIRYNRVQPVLTVSPIFEKYSKQRSTAASLISKYTKGRSFTTTFLYSYDQYHKNFSPYLTANSSYDFLILARLKNSQIFGVISKGLGAGSKAYVFNANSGKFFAGDEKMSCSIFQGGSLIFGQGEIRFKSNSNLELVVNSRIFYNRCFTFKKEELIGKDQTGETIVMQAMEIHRINYS